jgi:hypothetical protein
VIVCVVAYLLTGHRSIYPSQRLTRFKTQHQALSKAVSLREAHTATGPDARATRPPANGSSGGEA